MALAVVLRNCTRLQGKQLMQSTFLISTRRNFTLSQKIKNDLLKSCTKKFEQPIQKRLMSGDHSTKWTLEKALSLALVGLIPVGIAWPSFVMDNVLALSCVLHFHWGIEAVVEDYVRVVLFGPTIPKIAVMLVYVVSAVTLGGLIYYNVNDIGVGKTIRKFWAIKG